MLIKRRAAGEPLQHLLGTVEFHGRSFLCDPRALIPRPETEHLVELSSPCEEKPSRILDAGTGSGVIALTLAAEWPEAAVDASDISPRPSSLAAENATRLDLAGRVRFLKATSSAPSRANTPSSSQTSRTSPPAISPALSREVRGRPALRAGWRPRWRGRHSAFLDQARAHLLPGGSVALEIGAGQADMLVEHLRLLGYNDIRATADYAGIIRFLFANHG